MVDIRHAFLHLAQECHPDLHPDDRQSEVRFKRIRRVYEILSDPISRAAYDEQPSRFQLRECGAFVEEFATVVARPNRDPNWSAASGTGRNGESVIGRPQSQRRTWSESRVAFLSAVLAALTLAAIPLLLMSLSYINRHTAAWPLPAFVEKLLPQHSQHGERINERLPRPVVDVYAKPERMDTPHPLATPSATAPASPLKTHATHEIHQSIESLRNHREPATEPAEEEVEEDKSPDVLLPPSVMPGLYIDAIRSVDTFHPAPPAGGSPMMWPVPLPARPPSPSWSSTTLPTAIPKSPPSSDPSFIYRADLSPPVDTDPALPDLAAPEWSAPVSTGSMTPNVTNLTFGDIATPAPPSGAVGWNPSTHTSAMTAPLTAPPRSPTPALPSPIASESGTRLGLSGTFAVPSNAGHMPRPSTSGFSDSFPSTGGNAFPWTPAATPSFSGSSMSFPGTSTFSASPLSSIPLSFTRVLPNSTVPERVMPSGIPPRELKLMGLAPNNLSPLGSNNFIPNLSPLPSGNLPNSFGPPAGPPIPSAPVFTSPTALP